MSKSVKLGFVFATMIGFALLSSSANAGHGNAVGAGLLGFGVGAIVGSTLAPREVYVVPGPPPPAYYGPAAYGPTTLEPGLVELLPHDLWALIQSKHRILPCGRWRLVLLPVKLLLRTRS
jgi:hypothetical protein